MAYSIGNRPFDNFRVTITDPPYFWGRSQLLKSIQASPCQVRILLGGRRIGKTSVLRAIEWTLLDSAPDQVPETFEKNASSGEREQNASQTRPQWINKFFPTFSKILPPQDVSKIAPVEQVTSSHDGIRAFPVFLSLQVEQPADLESLRYLMISRLREAMDRWRRVPGTVLREMYRDFLSQIASGEVTLGFLSAIDLSFNIKNPDYEKKLTHDEFRTALLRTIKELQSWHFDGVCFLMDGADFIVDQAWANNAWSYLRGLKDTDTALKPFVGYVFSGYRNLRDYQQAIGSPLLNIAQIDWITLLTPTETQDLIAQRSEDENVSLNDADIATVLSWAGGHPYLTHQVLNLMFDRYRQDKSLSLDKLEHELLRQHDRDFSVWWSDPKRPYSFGDKERAVYQALLSLEKADIERLAKQTSLSYGDVADTLEVVSGTGVIRRSDTETYEVGSQLFAEWVQQQQPIS